MPDLIGVFARWWKRMLIIIVLSIIITGLIVFLQPPQFLSTATAVPGSSYGTDRSRLFNENIQILYPGLGNPDDLDMIIGTAQLDTIYLAVTDQFNLYDHYKIKNQDNNARVKSAAILKKRTRVIKSDFGELKVKTWDTDKNLAPQLANALLHALEMIHTNLQSVNNKTTLEGLENSKNKLIVKIDSISNYLKKAVLDETASEEMSARKKSLSDQLQQYEKLIAEYELMMDTKTPSIVMVESAKPGLYPDKPKKAQTLIITFVLSFFFSFFVALVMERRKQEL